MVGKTMLPSAFSKHLSPFDAVAAHYDEHFTHTALGCELRRRVWQQLAERFPPGSRVLELNCGTGEDAAWLASRGVEVVATDASPAMLAAAQRKTPGMSVETLPLDLADPQADFPLASFDGAISNFGGLNCVEDLRPLAQALARWLKPGAKVVLVIMGPVCLWEILWYLLHGQPRLAVRRWQRKGVVTRIGEQVLRVFYPWPGEIIRLLSPEFRYKQLVGIGVTLPPTYAANWIERREQFRRLCTALEGCLARTWPFMYLGDHYLLEMERR